MTRALVSGVVTLLLIGATVWCVALGVETAPSTGGLLLAPVPLTRISGGWVLGAVAAGTAALLCAVDAGVRVVRLRRG